MEVLALRREVELKKMESQMGKEFFCTLKILRRNYFKTI